MENIPLENQILLILLLPVSIFMLWYLFSINDDDSKNVKTFKKNNSSPDRDRGKMLGTNNISPELSKSPNSQGKKEAEITTFSGYELKKDGDRDAQLDSTSVGYGLNFQDYLENEPLKEESDIEVSVTLKIDFEEITDSVDHGLNLKQYLEDSSVEDESEVDDSFTPKIYFENLETGQFTMELEKITDARRKKLMAIWS